MPPSYAEDLDPAATNLFFHHNRIHDEFHGFGFTETGDNFQVNNNGADDANGDPILGLVQAGAVSGGAPLYTGRDNAYMLTLSDGLPPTSGMFLWEPIDDAFEGPCRDGDFDAGVIEHEYAHGLTNRYVSAEDNALNAHQSGSMGEGCGDWYGLNYLHREGLDDRSVVGEYVTGNPQRGIRNRSTTATAVRPTTRRSSSRSGPRSPRGVSASTLQAAEATSSTRCRRSTTSTPPGTARSRRPSSTARRAGRSQQANGARVVSSTSPNAKALLDDTESSTVSSTPGGKWSSSWPRRRRSALSRSAPSRSAPSRPPGSRG